MAEDLVRPTDRVQVMHPVREQPTHKDRPPPRQRPKKKRAGRPQPNDKDGEHGTLDVEA